ncbi:MAG TPA: transposase [Gaiellaceae bacterium]|nr:transposase [Gaiellaceae bacterium]
MSNPIRIEIVGAYYHINSNALDGMSLFRDDVDRLQFLELLGKEIGRSEWTLLEYTLMTTHYHLLLKLNKPTLSSGFQHLHSLYARYYNRRHARRGVVWQRRFHDELIESDPHLLECIRYIALNPPRANMCAKAEEWPWSSYGASIGVHEPDFLVETGELLAFFGSSRRDARRKLRAFVEERDPRERRRQIRLRRASDAED